MRRSFSSLYRGWLRTRSTYEYLRSENRAKKSCRAFWILTSEAYRRCRSFSYTTGEIIAQSAGRGEPASQKEMYSYNARIWGKHRAIFRFRSPNVTRVRAQSRKIKTLSKGYAWYYNQFHCEKLLNCLNDRSANTRLAIYSRACVRLSITSISRTVFFFSLPPRCVRSSLEYIR